MATREQVTLEMGINSEGVAKGLGVGHKYVNDWVGYVQNTEEKYTSWWATELKKREELEVAASVKAAKRAIEARRLLRERERLREQQVNVELSQGSGGYGFLKTVEGMTGAGGGGYAAAKNAETIAAKGAAGALKEVAAEGKVSAGAWREVTVLIREGFRGNYSRMAGSASILIQRLGLTASALGGLAAIAAEVGIILYYTFSMRNATKGLEASQAREREITPQLAKRLRQDVEDMQKAGRINKDLADKMMTLLANPTLERISLVAKTLRPYGDVNKKDAAEIAKLEAEHMNKLIQWNRENQNLTDRYVSDLVRAHMIKDAMAQMDRHSLAYAQAQLALDDAEHEVQEDQKKIAEGKLEIQRKINQEQKLYAEAQLHIKELHQHEMEKFMPTLEELARHGGVGGRTARLLERQDRRIKRDFFHGDTASAGRDIEQRNRLYDTLANRGLAPEREELREIRKINDEMQLHLKAIAEGKAILKAKIAMG